MLKHYVALTDSAHLGGHGKAACGDPGAVGGVLAGAHAGRQRVASHDVGSGGVAPDAAIVPAGSRRSGEQGAQGEEGSACTVLEQCTAGSACPDLPVQCTCSSTGGLPAPCVFMRATHCDSPLIRLQIATCQQAPLHSSITCTTSRTPDPGDPAQLTPAPGRCPAQQGPGIGWLALMQV